MSFLLSTARITATFMCTFHFLSHFSYVGFGHMHKYGRDSLYTWILVQSDATTHLITSIAFYTMKMDLESEFGQLHCDSNIDVDIGCNHWQNWFKVITVNIMDNYNFHLGGIFLFYFLWHHIKVLDKTWTLRNIILIDAIEMLCYAFAALLMFNFHPFFIAASAIVYGVFRYFDIVW